MRLDGAAIVGGAVGGEHVALGGGAECESEIGRIDRAVIGCGGLGLVPAGLPGEGAYLCRWGDYSADSPLVNLFSAHTPIG